jgi:hypothetical protein
MIVGCLQDFGRDAVTRSTPIALASILALVLACSDSGGGGTDQGTAGDVPAGSDVPAGGDVTLTATLAKAALSSGLNAATSALNGLPLAGYALYCVTFSDPPAGAKGSSDADGKVTLTLAAKGVPFGCFVLDGSGGVVATVVFQSSDANAQTVTVSASTDLGEVTVDLVSGVATVSAPAGATVGSATPTDVGCPVGAWVTVFGPSGCATGKEAKETIWIAKTPEGKYLVSFLDEYLGDPTGPGCGLWGMNNVEVVYADGAITIDLASFDSGCPANSSTWVFKAAADCKTATVTGEFKGCANCGGGGPGGCAGCGTTKCAVPAITYDRK